MTTNFVDFETSQQLIEFYNKFKNSNNLKQLFNDSGDRASRFSLDDLGFYIDYSKNWVDDFFFRAII